MARSDNWRINKSSIMAVEGAQLLKALQKVAGAAGLPSKFKIRFATTGKMSGIDFDKHEVIIGAGRLFEEAPIPAEKMDVLVGLMLHASNDIMEKVLKILPSLKRPTVTHLRGQNWFSVFTIVDKKELIKLIPRLKRIGCTDIIEFSLRKVIP